MLSILRMFNTYFFKTIYGPVLAFIFPVLLLGILGSVLKIDYVFPGIVAMGSIFVTVLSMPLGILEMRNSSLFKYIGASPTDAKQFFLVIIFYYILVNFLSILILAIMTMAFFSGNVFTGDRNGLFTGIGTSFGAFSFIIANLFHIALGLSLGMAIVAFSKTPQQALTISIMIIIPSIFLSGMVISVDIIAESDVMQIVSRFIPFRYTTGNIIVASTPLGQTGDFLALLNLSQKRLLFSNVTDQGKVLFNNVEIGSAKQVMDYYRASPSNFYNTGWIKDRPLFELIFVDSNIDAMSRSNNNIFAILDSFGVRKIPDVAKVEEFTQKYLSKTLGPNGDLSGINAIADLINKNEFDWMDLFLKQTSKLFWVFDKILNLFLPVVLIGALQFYAFKSFRWSAR